MKVGCTKRFWIAGKCKLVSIILYLQYVLWITSQKCRLLTRHDQKPLSTCEHTSRMFMPSFCQKWSGNRKQKNTPPKRNLQPCQHHKSVVNFTLGSLSHCVNKSTLLLVRRRAQLTHVGVFLTPELACESAGSAQRGAYQHNAVRSEPNSSPVVQAGNHSVIVPCFAHLTSIRWEISVHGFIQMLRDLPDSQMLCCASH